MNISSKHLGALAVAGLLVLGGCSGDTGDPGPKGDPGPQGPPGQDLTATARPESCVVCHSGAGAEHQAAYNRYKDASRLELTIDGIATVDPDGDGTYTSTMTVTIRKDGQPYVSAGLAGLNQKTFYAVTYDGAGKFLKTVQYTGPAATATPGVYTLTATKETSGASGTNVSTGLSFKPEETSAVAFGYVADEPMTFEAFGVFDNVAHDGLELGTVDYVSAANVSGCEKCHGTPYMKHGYRVARTPDLDDFAACKVCHYDTRNGGHQDWQCLVDDPAAYAAGTCTTKPEWARYAYKATVMNDVHMSHAMEFAYPQSMANCVTCHEGKLGQVLSDANFQLSTCKSCHPVTGPADGTDPKRAPALKAVLPTWGPHAGDLYNYTGTACNSCHNASGGGAPVFSQIHIGYDKIIYAGTTGTKYSDAFATAITAASKTGDVLSFTFTVTEATDLPNVSVDDVSPIAYFAPYGYGTKDFILPSLNQDFAAATKTGFTASCSASGNVKTCDVSVDLATASNGTNWTARIADGSIKRVELGVRPVLRNKDGIMCGSAACPVALTFKTRTFDLVANGFADTYYKPIVDAAKCDKCHGALGTTFHTADRGGNVVGCRICHVTLNGGSHLEMQSRSIDSYVHAIHSFQPFDVGDVDFTDPVEALKYEHHVESTFPNFTLLNCESCHNPGTYEVPDQTRSLPGLHSAADAVATWDRNIGAVPSYITGPASRACGGCHRAELINEDDASGLAAFNEHVKAGGYLLDAATTTLTGVIAKVMSYFE